MAIVVLLGFAAYATVVSEKGGGATFKVWRPERMRFAVLVLVVVGAAAYELRPGKASRPKEEPERELQGVEGHEAALRAIRKVWMQEECPLEYENVRPDFSEEQGVFARAALRLKCGLDAPFARQRLREL